MGQYLHLFPTKGEFDEMRNGAYEEPWVSYTEENAKIDYNKTEEEKLPETPLTFEITSDGALTLGFWRDYSHVTDQHLVYTKNDDVEKPFTSTLYVKAGDIIKVKAEEGYKNHKFESRCFSGNCLYNIYGNIMSLVDGTDFGGLTTLSSAYTFFKLFYGCSGLTDASKLLLPATTLADGCYGSMFELCKNLTGGPAELLATTLTKDCYTGMFRDCTSLTKAPELPAASLAEDCYFRMFRDCPNLSYIKCLATDITASNCTHEWLNGVASSGTFVKAASMTGWTTGNNGIPTNWTVQNA